MNVLIFVLIFTLFINVLCEQDNLFGNAAKHTSVGYGNHYFRKKWLPYLIAEFAPLILKKKPFTVFTSVQGTDAYNL